MFQLKQTYKLAALEQCAIAVDRLKSAKFDSHKLQRQLIIVIQREVSALIDDRLPEPPYNQLNPQSVSLTKRAARRHVTILYNNMLRYFNVWGISGLPTHINIVAEKTNPLYTMWNGMRKKQEQFLSRIPPKVLTSYIWGDTTYTMGEAAKEERRLGLKQRAGHEKIVANFWQLTYKSNVGEGFFFSLTTPRTYHSRRRIKFVGWSAGNNAVVTKAARRSVKNILSWWNYIFSDVLQTLFFDIYTKEHNMLLMYFKSMNNLTMRYFFMNHLYMKNINYIQSLYFIKYNFFVKNVIRKKIRYMKKFKKKGLVHADRFTRREFWIVSKR